MKARAVAQARRAIPARRPPASAAPARFALPAGMQRWLAMLLLIAAVSAAMWPVCRSDFSTWDDSFTIRDNPTLNPVAWDSVRRWWDAPFMDLYIPLTYTAWGIVAEFARVPATGGAEGAAAYLNPAPFHVANLLVHLSAVLVVFGLLRTLVGKTWPAAAGAMLFGLHPVQVEAVAWTSGMKDVLGGFLALSAIWLYLLAVRHKREMESRRCAADFGELGRAAWRWHYAIATVLFALAMLAKPAEVVAPVLAWALDAIVLGRSWRESARWLWPWAMLAAGGAAETFAFQGAHVDANNIALYLRPMVALDSLTFYVGKLVWPGHMGFDYGLRPAVLVRDPWLAIKCVLLVSAGVLLWLRRAKAGALVAAAAVFVLALLPVLGLVTFDFQSYSNVANHYLYVAMLGPALAAAWVCARWDRAAVFATAGLALAALGWVSNHQARYWKDAPTLLHHEMAINPESPTVYRALAVYALADKNYLLARKYAEHALRLDPDDPGAHFALAGVLWHEGWKIDAIRHYQAGLKNRPDDVNALEAMAAGMYDLGRFPEAEWYIRRQLGLMPNSGGAHYRLGLILFQEHRLGESIEELQRAVNEEPDSMQFRTALNKAKSADKDASQ